MFATAKTALTRGIDRTIEFATLGEYRSPVQGVVQVPERRKRQGQPSRTAVRRARNVPPATAAARNRAFAARPLPRASAIRSLALDPPHRPSPPSARKRVGSPPTPAQDCLF